MSKEARIKMKLWIYITVRVLIMLALILSAVWFGIMAARAFD